MTLIDRRARQRADVAFAPERATASIGTIASVTPTGVDHFTTRYLAPAGRFPQVAIIVVDLVGGGQHLRATARLPLHAATEMPLPHQRGRGGLGAHRGPDLRAGARRRAGQRHHPDRRAARRARRAGPRDRRRRQHARDADRPAAGAVRADHDLWPRPSSRSGASARCRPSAVTRAGRADRARARPCCGRRRGWFTRWARGAPGRRALPGRGARAAGNRSAAADGDRHRRRARAAAGAREARRDRRAAGPGAARARSRCRRRADRLVIGSGAVATVGVAARDRHDNPTSLRRRVVTVDGRPVALTPDGKGCGQVRRSAARRRRAWAAAVEVEARLGALHARTFMRVTPGPAVRLAASVSTPERRRATAAVGRGARAGLRSNRTADDRPRADLAGGGRPRRPANASRQLGSYVDRVHPESDPDRARPRSWSSRARRR